MYLLLKSMESCARSLDMLDDVLNRMSFLDNSKMNTNMDYANTIRTHIRTYVHIIPSQSLYSELTTILLQLRKCTYICTYIYVLPLYTYVHT